MNVDATLPESIFFLHIFLFNVDAFEWIHLISLLYCKSVMRRFALSHDYPAKPLLNRAA